MANVLEWRQSARGWRRRVKTLLASPGDQVVEVIQWCAPALGAATVASLEADCASCRCARALTSLAEGLYQAHLIPSVAGMRELGALASRLGLTEADWNIWAALTSFDQDEGHQPPPYDPCAHMRVRDAVRIASTSLTCNIEVAYLDDALDTQKDLNHLSRLLTTHLNHIQSD